MSSRVKPILLCADSQLLFWETGGAPFLNALKETVGKADPAAAYVGASNDDRPEFYELFRAAMENVGITKCRMIPSEVTAEDEAFLREADIILLAGGDALKGWRTFEKNGLRELIAERYLDGVVLVGVSAGAAQLGLYVWPEDESREDEPAGAFGFVPFVVGAHGEGDSWRRLRSALRRAQTAFTAIGIPTGGGALYHADRSLEPVRKPLEELSLVDGRVKVGLLYPHVGGARGPDEVEESPHVC
jgi:peptidase E